MRSNQPTSNAAAPSGLTRGPALETLEPRRMLDAAALDAPAEFIQNLGQWDSDIHYLYRGQSANVAFTDQGLSFAGLQQTGANVLAEAVNVRFDGARAVAPTGLNQTGGRFNYHVGANAAAWVSGAQAFATVAYYGLYDGIDLFVTGGAANLKYEYHLAPGADPSDILARYDGAENVFVDSAGALHVDLGAGELIDDAPFTYQDINGVRVAVDSAFVVADDGSVRFALGAYDASVALVIDPAVGWGAYQGGDDQDDSYAVAMDAYNCVYAAGWTYSAGWVTGGFDTTYGGNGDAFVMKYSRNGTRLWTTYLGGTEHDIAYGVTVSNAGRVYVVGETESAGWTSGGVGDHSYNSGSDAFVARLRRTGAHVWSGYLGGSARDRADAVACGANEAIHIAGETFSAGWIAKGPDTTYAGGGDGFYTRMWFNGKTLRGSYLGGTNSDVGEGVAVDNRGDVIVCGNTTSTGWVVKGKDTSYGGGDGDGFVTKFAAGGRHVWSRYLGAGLWDQAFHVAIGKSNRIIVTGRNYDLPAVDSDAVVYCMKTTGQDIWSSAIGGANGHENGLGVAVDGLGDVYVVGWTGSTGWTVGGADTTHNGNNDGFVARFNAAGTLLWSSFFGGTGNDYGQAVTPDSYNGVHIVGQTNSSGWLTGGFDSTQSGFNDGFTLWTKR